ncbi:MAG: NifB/NifX family molybdenum-iron cluster-binding protein [Prolixibacteraceae bacterium]
MRIAIPIEIKQKSSIVSKQFARSNYFAVVDRTTKTVELIDNPYTDLSMGVGKKLLNLLVEKHKVDTLLAFELGLKVQQKAIEANLQLIVISEKRQTLKQLLTYLKIE